MPFSHNRLQNTIGIQVFSQINKYTLYYRFLNGNVQGCVFAKNRPVSLNWTDYMRHYVFRYTIQEVLTFNVWQLYEQMVGPLFFPFVVEGAFKNVSN